MKIIVNILIIFAFIITLPIHSFGQLSKWLVPETNGVLHLIDFSISPPFVTVPNPNYGYGCGEEVNIMTDEEGQIFFSLAGINTSTIEVRDANWEIMPNGYGLRGHFSTIESCIVKIPCTENKYYIIHSNKVTYPGNLYYSIVDMSLNNGLGDITDKNILITELYFYEGKDISHQLPSGCRWFFTIKNNIEDLEIVRFLITDKGIENETRVDIVKDCNALELEISPDNTRIAVATRSNFSSRPDIVVYDFDLESGTISNKQEFFVTDQKTAGVEFSRNGTKLYYRTNISTDNSELGRINLNNNEVHIIDNYMGRYATGIEMASNHCIYVTKSYNENYLSEIANPDAEDISQIEFTKNAVFISMNGMRSGMPDAIDGEIPNSTTTPSYIDFDYLSTNNCNEFLFADLSCLSSWWEWNFGDGNISNEESPIHQYIENGLYNVTLRIVSCGDTLSLSKELVVNQMNDILDLGNDTIVCSNPELTLHAGPGFQSYLWQDGSIDSILIVNSTGLYWVEVIDDFGCIYRDSIQITMSIGPSIDLGNDTSLCEGDYMTLYTGQKFDQYLWQDGSTDSAYTVFEEGSYYVTVYNICGANSDTINIYYYQNPIVDISDVVCIGLDEIIILDAGEGYSSYLWQDGSFEQTIIINNPGIYWVTVSDGFCYGSDTIVIKKCYSTIWFPNSFTPNGDGINDIFKPKYESISDYHIYIFNRWGQLLYESIVIDEGWNGKYKGRLCPNGVYYYIANYKSNGSKQGSVTLLR